MEQAQEWVADTARESTFVVVAEATKRPNPQDHFKHEFARIRALAGLPSDLQFRDLRRSALTDAANHGTTDDELRALGVHKGREIVATYVLPTGEQAASAQRKRQRKQNRAPDEA